LSSHRQGVFLGEKLVLSKDDIDRALTRIAHEILERNKGPKDLVLVGMRTRGAPLAERLGAKIKQFENLDIPIGSLDIGLYRDDISEGINPLVQPTHIPVDIERMKVILIDDVIYTGRSIRAAMDALTDLGRPQLIQFGALVDRGHRELPIRADYVGKNVPTARNEQINVRLLEIDGKDEVVLLRLD